MKTLALTDKGVDGLYFLPLKRWNPDVPDSQFPRLDSETLTGPWPATTGYKLGLLTHLVINNFKCKKDLCFMLKILKSVYLIKCVLCQTSVTWYFSGKNKQVEKYEQYLISKIEVTGKMVE